MQQELIQAMSGSAEAALLVVSLRKRCEMLDKFPSYSSMYEQTQHRLVVLQAVLWCQVSSWAMCGLGCSLP